MIRKTLAFLALVAVGLVVLRLVTGDEGFSGDRAGEHAAPRKTATAAETGGIQIGSSDQNGSDLPQGLSVKVGGKMSLPRNRTVQIGNRTRELQVYLLKCEDSVPIGDDRLQMLDLTVDFFEIGGPPEDPREIRVATLTAVEAFAQLGLDDKGRTSIEEDKEMRVIGARVETTQEARIPNLTLDKLDEALLLATEKGIRVHTPDSTQAFRLQVTGEEPLQITGRGLEAWVPRQGGPGDQVMVDVLSRPVLVQQTAADGVTRLSARGKLTYRENPANGRTIILMQDEVRISMAAAGVGSDPLEATGERLQAQLTRQRSSLAGDSEKAGERATQWQRIWLAGDQVTLTATGAELRCEDLEILPGIGGQPYLFTASGSPAVMEYRDADGVLTRAEASRRIHVVRPGSHQAPVFTAMGFPAWSLGPLNRHELVIIEGAADLKQGDNRHLKASDGLWLLRSLRSDDWASALLQPRGSSSGAPLAMHGSGDVEIHQRGEADDLSLRGNMGFTLVESGEIRHIRLGPKAVAPAHRYTVKRGDLDLAGVGSCVMTQSPDRVTVALRAPGPQIDGGFGPELGSLQGAVSLDAAISRGALESFSAAGPVCRILRGPDGELEAIAQRVESLDPESVRLSGTVTAPAQAHYRPRGTADDGSVRARDVHVFGSEIRIHRLSGDHMVIEAVVPEPSLARVQLEVIRGTQPPTRVDLHARRIRFLPFAVDPAALYLQALPPGARQVFALGLRSPYLLAEEQVSIIQEEQAGTQRASGDFLLLGLATRAGYLTGNPARIERRDAREKTLIGTASRVDMRSESDGELLGLVATADRLPELELVDPTGSLNASPGEPSRMRVVCAEDIRVYPEVVRFPGSVEMQTLRPDGSEDPEGLKMRADLVTMARDAQTGEIVEVQATGNVHLDWSRVVAGGHSLTLDPAASLITVSDPDRNAIVDLPSGWRYTGGMIRANYRTYRVTSWFSRIDGGGRGR